MRVVTYNVRYFSHGLKGLASTAASKAKIASAIASLTPLADVIAMQEVETQSLRSAIAHRGARQTETQLDAFLRHLDADFLARGSESPYRAFYYPAHTYRVGALNVYTTGLAILVNGRTLDVLSDNSAKPHHVTHGSALLGDVKQTRIAAHVRLEDASGHRFHVVNTHLSLPTLWAKEYWSQGAKMGFGQNQLAEATKVAAYAAAAAGDEPYVIVGDFNSAPATPVYRYLTEQARLLGAQEALRQIDPKHPNSWSTAGFMRMRMHLDHVFGGNGVVFDNLRDTLPFGDRSSRFHGLSDHVPLVATLGFV